MNPEQQRIAIAEACGWDTEECKSGYGIPYFKGIGMGEDEESLPDYLKDLNAIHEAEGFLEWKKVGLADIWLRELHNCVVRDFKDAPDQFYAHATAAQRAEAFLKTLGLWVNDEKITPAESAPTTPHSSTKETP